MQAGLAQYGLFTLLWAHFVNSSLQETHSATFLQLLSILKRTLFVHFTMTSIYVVQAKSTSSKQASFRESISASENDLKSDRTWRMGFHKLCKGDLCKTGETWHYMAPFLVNSARCMHQIRLLEHFDSMLDKFSPYTLSTQTAIAGCKIISNTLARYQVLGIYLDWRQRYKITIWAPNRTITDLRRQFVHTYRGLLRKLKAAFKNMGLWLQSHNINRPVIL